MVLKNGGTVAAPRSKRNVRYVAPRDLPNSTFGGTSLHHGTATLDLPPHMFGKITTGEGLFLAGSAPVIIAATAGVFALGGMFESWSQEFFIGNKRSLTYKQVAIRNGSSEPSLGQSELSRSVPQWHKVDFTQAWKVRQ